MSKNKALFKSFGYEIKEVSEEGIVEGYASVFNIIDQGDDVVERGAFKKTIRDSKGVWPILHMHDTRVKIGFNLEAKEDDYGLWFREQLALDVQAGREQFALTKLAHKVKGPDGISIGYSAIKAEPDRERPAVRRLKELKMWEHSHVTFGMNQAALTTAAKNWRLEVADVGIGEHTDLFFKHMEFLGFDVKEVLEALRNHEAARKVSDPDKIIQSVDRAISVLKAS